MNVRDMVLQRRLDYGFNGYQVPVVPRASRSARGRGPIKKKCEDKQKRAFEILASVAGKLLLESESSGCSNAACAKDQDNIVKNHDKWEQEDQRQLLYENPCEKETCDEKTFACVPGMRGHRQSYTLNECSHMQDNFGFNINLTSDNRSEKTSFPEKLATVNSRNAFGSPSSKVGGDSTCTGEYFASLVGGVIERKVEAEPSIIRNHKQGTLPFRGSLDDRTELERKPPAVVCSESNVKASLFRDCVTPGSVSRHYDNVKVVSRDDDENPVGCTHPSAMVKAYRPLPDIIDRRIRNLSASKCWRLAPNLFGTDGKAKPVYRKVRTCYGRQRSQRISSFKRRKFFDRSPLSKSNGRFRFEGIFNSPHKRSNGDNCVASAKLNAIGGSTPVAGQQAPPRSGNCNVKLSIKSFKVPELFVEIPATATVGSLKRTVMEAVTAILGDGLHVGVLLRGKKVRDDSKTLLQTGISQDDKHRSLGFMLEPRHAQIMPPPCTEDRLLPGGTPQGHTKQTASPVLQPGTSNISQIPPVMNLDSCVETDLKAVPLLADTSTNNAMPQSRTLVAVPAISMEALAMVPLHRKSGHPEYIQRRIRRPFSVSEVEALVQAVEELGTGRWRDVKLRAFENANYRTYVDLKDKWKTLVHTARISPQQRRGEPVPQELLDRVLAADSYWSQQQAKHQVKSTSLRLCL